MLKTLHRIYFRDSRNLKFIPSESVHLVVTSPPYPMIEMWDELFISLNNDIGTALKKNNVQSAFSLMHRELDKVWQDVYRVLINGGIACINIGDATRTINKHFRLYTNHSRILRSCLNTGFSALPVILWRKPTNAPNKFMGSGMLPASAYVTLEHEYILILRKGNTRSFVSREEKENRRQSAYFWEERNSWFSDIWDLKGIRQDLNYKDLRKRSAAFPFEVVLRLILMYSVKGDTVLDPFLGTGTTMFAAMASCRNSIGLEIDEKFRPVIRPDSEEMNGFINRYVSTRLENHYSFIDEYKLKKGNPKHINKHYHFPVITSQETDMIIHYIDTIEKTEDETYEAIYIDKPVIKNASRQLSLF
jgi:DNA modification methylase